MGKQQNNIKEPNFLIYVIKESLFLIVREKLKLDEYEIIQPELV